jgi:protein-disulfide isomerase
VRITAILAALAGITLCGAAEAPASAADATFSPAQKAAVEQIVHDYLAAHPEAVLDALKALEAKQHAAQAQAAKAAIVAEEGALKHDPSSYVAGNPAGDVTIVEFFDYNCGYCRGVAPTMQSLLSDDKKLRLVIKEWPIKGADSIAAARVSVAAAKQPQFLAFHFALLASEGHVDEARALDAAKKAGLDMDKLKRDKAAVKPEDIIRQNDALASKIGIDGTPAFVIGSTVVPGAASADEFKALIAQTRKACKTSSC